jgi:chemotaxis protein methyltransferase CheR
MIAAGDYEFLQQFLKQRSGLNLSQEKQYLIESRLTPVARKAGLANVEELIAGLRAAPTGAVADAVVEAMTTNESSFFRDKTPFEAFISFMVPSLIDRRGSRRIRVWCAAASTGQEPYSLAMILKENAHLLPGVTVEILATDIAAHVLDRAREGIYSAFEVQRGLPIQYLLKYFEQKGDQWQIRPEIRAMVQFRQFNLLQSFAGLGTFDIIFCRNVLIYFDIPTKADVLSRMAKVLAPDGYLVLGAAETVMGISDAFRSASGRPGVYIPNRMAEAAE